jgi:cytochrome P450
MPLQSLEYIRRPLRLFEDCRDRYGEPFTLRIARGAPFVVFSDPEAIKAVFTAPPSVLRSGAANEVFEAGLGRRSLLVLDGDEHLRDRKLMLPPFHGERMRGYGELIDRIAEREIAGWPSHAPFPVATSTRRIALAVVVGVVFGVVDEARVRQGMKLIGDFLDSATGELSTYALIQMKPGGPFVRAWNRFAPAKRRVDAVIYEEIRRRRDDPERDRRGDILSMLTAARYEDGRPMSDEHLRDELVTLLTAGHETTASTTAWALEELARRPEVAERVAADDAYAEAAVKETLRLWPVVPSVVRLATEPFEVCGWELPAGVRLAPSVHLVHRRPDVYPRPDLFRPERFLEREAGTYTWIPFGGGTRRCLGAAFATFEMKRVLRAAARAGRFEPVAEDEGDVGRRGLTLAPRDGARLVWRPAG